MRKVKITHAPEEFADLIGQTYPAYVDDNITILFTPIGQKSFLRGELFFNDAGIIPVIEAVKIAYNQFNPLFGVQEFSRQVNVIREKYVTDGCVTRRLRDLKEDGAINYTYNAVTKLYKKLPVNEKAIQQNLEL